ncbi:MAG: SsrA-binding protein [Dethiosulfovibrio peptidovorans]|nr:MAG: SsrA-binding protein [Dethiosulfovibrio peptidovorans]
MAVERVSHNRKARHDYFIVDTYECGIVLTGTEIKSIRAGRVNLKDGYAKLDNRELWLFNIHISPYEHASWRQHEPTRKRKLLMRKGELRRIASKVKERGFTLIPLSLYIKDGRWAKVELGLAKGKALHDKRNALAEKDAKRTMERELRNRQKD